ncbi:vWA domain-containing protein [Paraflavitalea pollutisoli]|uniref:vWA domain-containing protein n=1 Tax=Paraflavitalea pollutisoli TaxID=3034143 RepID=UPI0023ED15EC|nr:von Willebrand factor type A domain-containing protein [Paraflavitalea sp. H1-2-19X]
MKYLLTLFVWCAGIFVLAAQSTITGKITDVRGAPIQGVSITCKGTSMGTTSDAKGAYSIQVADKQAILVFAMVGYNKQEIRVGAQTVINIRLKTSEHQLQEVVVTRLGAPLRKAMNNSSAYSGRVYGMSFNNQGYISGGDKGDLNREGYDHIKENEFQRVTNQPVSTFSIDVDAASYSNVRRLINEGRLPEPGAVRIEEMINYFSYNYPQPKADQPFSVITESMACPWNEQHQLVMIGLQGKKIEADQLPPSNLVFLIDVSGSMQAANKLPLVRSSLKLLADQLRPQDKISIVVYAGSAGLVLPATNDKNKIREAIDELEAGGSTAGGAGIQLAYKTAQQHFLKGGNNRVILCTDGDFNVGASSDDALENLIEEKRASGVYLTVLGFGTGNYQDGKMQKLAGKGNGNHAYIDDLPEAKKVLISEFGGTLFTIAKDVKLQVEFNPQQIKGYRLIGYENRLLATENFNNDKKDAGDMGSNHTVTALYEVIPASLASDQWLAPVDMLRYQTAPGKAPGTSFSREWMFVKLRYKKPDEDKSHLLEVAVKENGQVASNNIRFASAVAAFGMVLRNSTFKGSSSYKLVRSLAGNSIQNNNDPYKKEFLDLVKRAENLKATARQEEEE